MSARIRPASHQVGGAPRREAAIPSTIGRSTQELTDPLAGPDRTLWSTDPSSWSGFPLRGGRLALEARLERPVSPCERLLLCTAGHAVFSNRCAERTYDGVCRPGLSHLVQKGFEWESVSWTGSIDFTEVRTDTAHLTRLLAQEELPPPLSMRFLVHDVRLQSLVASLVEEAFSGNPSGSLYTEALSLALLVYTRAHYASSPPRPTVARQRSARLTPTHARTVCDYIDANLSEPLSLCDLSALCGLGPQQFSKLFKQTLGRTPHGYVLDRRVERGKRLLAAGREPIAAVALRLGFADQSHFTNVFKKLTGQTPRQFVRSR